MRIQYSTIPTSQPRWHAACASALQQRPASLVTCHPTRHHLVLCRMTETPCDRGHPYHHNPRYTRARHQTRHSSVHPQPQRSARAHPAAPRRAREDVFESRRSYRCEGRRGRRAQGPANFYPMSTHLQCRSAPEHGHPQPRRSPRRRHGAPQSPLGTRGSRSSRAQGS